jgi:hypothetical protein
VCVEAVLEARSNLLGSTSAEEAILGYKRVQGSFGGTSVGKEATKEESDVLNTPHKVPPASTAPPARLYVWGFLAVDTVAGYRPSTDEHRP